MKGLIRNELVKVFSSHIVIWAVLLVCTVISSWAVFNVLYLSPKAELTDNTLLPKQDLTSLESAAERKTALFLNTDSDLTTEDRQALSFSLSSTLADYYLCKALVENNIGYNHWKAEILSYYYNAAAEMLTDALFLGLISAESFSIDQEPEDILFEAGLRSDELLELKQIVVRGDWHKYYYFKLALQEQNDSVTDNATLYDTRVSSITSNYYKLAIEYEIEPVETNDLYLLWKRCLTAEKAQIINAVSADAVDSDEVKILKYRLKTRNPLPKQGSATYYLETAMKFSSVLFLAGMIVSCYLIQLESSHKTIDRLMLQPVSLSLIRNSKYIAGSIVQIILTACSTVICLLLLVIIFPLDCLFVLKSEFVAVSWTGEIINVPHFSFVLLSGLSTLIFLAIINYCLQRVLYNKYFITIILTLIVLSLVALMLTVGWTPGSFYRYSVL